MTYSWDEIDALLDTDTLRLRDVAWELQCKLTKAQERLEAKVERQRIELRDAHNDLLDVRGILAPAGYEPVTPLSLVPTVAPAVQWLVDQLAAGSDLVQSLEQQLAERGGPGIDARLQELAAQNNELSVYLASARKERDELRQHILDIDAHATPYGDIPDDPGWVGVYLLTAGALHRALGKIGHGAPKCEAEAALAAAEQDRDRLAALITRLADQLEDLSKGACWKGPRGYPACDNGGCVHRRQLLAEARALVPDAAEHSGEAEQP